MTAAAERGQQAEKLAEALLRREKMRVVARNVRFPVGELDLITWDGRTLCFVEVRSRASADFGSASESVTWRKQRRVIRAAQWYLKRQRVIPESIRFDVVAVDWSAAKPGIELIRSAFVVDPSGW